MAGFKLKIKINIDKARVKEIFKKRQKLIRKNISTALKKDAVPFLIERIMVGYDSLSERANILPEDPTNPANWRAEFLLKLEEDLERTFVINGDIISVRLGEKEFLGYNPSGTVETGDTEPLHWLVFFIEGLAGDWGFISPETYTKITKRPYQATWGRFSDGFMISRQDFEDQGWDSVMAFSQIRHPFSGFSPLDIFVEALREFRLRPFIEKAITAAAKGRQL